MILITMLFSGRIHKAKDWFNKTAGVNTGLALNRMHKRSLGQTLV